MEQVILVSSKVPSELPDTIYLSEEERKRANSFIKHDVKKAYQYQHHLLRQLLSFWLPLSPDEIRFALNPFGKPHIENTPFYFNISRSGDEIAFYFGPVEGGVDIETRRSSDPYLEITLHHFHANEQRAALSDDAFFSIWTRKEALLKAMGSGLQTELKGIDTTFSTLAHQGHFFNLATYKQDAALISLALPKEDFRSPECFRV